MSKSKPNVPIVATLNMKGGVGKTTISAHVFRVLYLRLEKRVLLIDFDPQFNLTQTVMPQKLYELRKQSQRTVLSVMEPPPAASLFSVHKTLGPPPKWDSIATRLKYLQDSNASLWLVPGDFGLVKYSLIADTKQLQPIKERFLAFIEAAKEEFDLICLDCNPSSSFMTLCALEAATHLVIPVRPDRYSVLGLELLDTFVSELPTVSKKPKQIIVLNGVSRSNYDPTVENALRSNPKFGPQTLSTPLFTSSILTAHPSYTGFATDKRVPNRYRLSRNINMLVDELGKELGLI